MKRPGATTSVATLCLSLAAAFAFAPADVPADAVPPELALAQELLDSGEHAAAIREALRVQLSASGDEGPSLAEKAAAFAETARRLQANEPAPTESGDATPPPAPLPIRLFIRFYRSQLSPATGVHCPLYPSCSEFFLQACQLHGWLGVAIGADRFFREPSVMGDASRLVVAPDDTLRYADPVEEHDFWLPAK